MNQHLDPTATRAGAVQALLAYHGNATTKPTIDEIINQAGQLTGFILGTNDAAALAYQTVWETAQTLFTIVGEFETNITTDEGRTRIQRAIDDAATALHHIAQGQTRA